MVLVHSDCTFYDKKLLVFDYRMRDWVLLIIKPHEGIRAAAKGLLRQSLSSSRAVVGGGLRF